MTWYCGKKGYYTSLALLVLQLPFVLVGIVARHNITSLPGVFGDLLAIVAITVIFVNTQRANKTQALIRKQVVTDGLTGLPNSLACVELVQALVDKKERFAVVSIDINGFKAINDTMGFDVGNNVLCEIASRWKTIVDTGVSGTLDFLARISGDEFVLLIRNYNSDEEMLNTIKVYESVLHNHLTIDNYALYITASFGYAEYPIDGVTAETLSFLLPARL